MSYLCPRRSIGGAGRGGERFSRIGRGVLLRPFDEAYFEAGVSPDSHVIEVFKDGEHRPQAIKANARQGWVTSYVVDAAGHVVRDAFDRPRQQTEYGAIELRRCD